MKTLKRKKFSYKLNGIVLLIFLFLLVGGAGSFGESGLTESTAKRIIESCFKDLVGLRVPDTIAYDFGGFRKSGKYKSVLLAKKLGLIKVTYVRGGYGPGGKTIENPKEGSEFSITLTEKGKNNSLRGSEGKTTWFIGGSRRIDEIVDIKKEQDGTYIVLFSGTWEPNTLRKEAVPVYKEFGITILESGKGRYKASIAYDSFLKKNIIRSMQYSRWEKEEWLNEPWIEESKDGRVVFMK